MTSRRLTRRTERVNLGLAGLAALAMLWLVSLGASPATAQIQSATPESYLRVHSVTAEPKRGRLRVTGYVYNTRDLYATRVQLLVESLDASGQAVASTTAWVYGDVPPNSRSYFDAAVSQAGATYRVTVRAVDWRGYGGGGG